MRAILKLSSAILAIALFLCPFSASFAGDEPFANDRSLFGRKEVVHQGTAAFTKWSSAIAAQSRAPSTDKVNKWKSFLGTLRGADPETQIEAVNRYMNDVPYITDKKNYGRDDYWATVSEFLERGGDCEDYALAKYHSLIQLGFQPNRLRLVILYDENKHINHAVLAVSYQGSWKILDNQSQTVRNDDEISYYKPIYAISRNNWWRFI